MNDIVMLLHRLSNLLYPLLLLKKAGFAGFNGFKYDPAFFFQC